MALADAFADETRRHPPGPRCNVGKLLERMPTEDADAFRNALADREWTVTSIVRVLEEHGYIIGDQPIARHRRGLCRCGKT